MTHVKYAENNWVSATGKGTFHVSGAEGGAEMMGKGPTKDMLPRLSTVHVPPPQEQAYTVEYRYLVPGAEYSS